MPPHTADSKSRFLSVCELNGISLDEKQRSLISGYVEKLLSHNKVHNLISRRDEENVWTRHILHSASLLFHRSFPAGARVLDLGTGGGLPGIVFAILVPSIHLTLLDATGKKIDTVAKIISELALGNVLTVRGRAEEFNTHSEYAGKYDIVVARAVAPLYKLASWAFPFLHSASTPGTDARTLPCRSLVAFKGGDIEAELKELSKKGGIVRTTPVDLKFAGSSPFLLDKKVVIVEF